jgi:hypothetical protein
MSTSPLVGTLYPVLADVMGRVTWFPFLVGLWSDQWPWASLVVLVYHFMVYLPLRQIANPALTAAQEFPSLESLPTARQMYMIIMPVVAISAALVGAVVRRLLRVPFHYVPIGRLIRTIWPVKEAYAYRVVVPVEAEPTPKVQGLYLGAVEISQRYSIYATIAFILALGGSLAAQEIYAWIHGGGATLDWILVFLPLAVTIVVLVPSFFFEPWETTAIFGTGEKVRTRALIAAAKIVAPTALVTCIPQIVAIYYRNVNVVILTGSMVIVGVFLLSMVLALTTLGDVPEGYKGAKKEEQRTMGTGLLA